MGEAPTADLINALKAADEAGALDYARRAQPLEGGRNFRDLGGYAAADGRHVRWGLLFRSGSMADLTEGDLVHIAKLGLRTICDLRTSGERDHQPTPAALLDGRNHWSRDYPSSFADLRKLMAGGLGTGEEARAAMIQGYRNIAFDQVPAFAEIFRRLLAGEVPMLFHCSAGKDRAGTAAAMVLSALGVSRADILADYALTAHAGLHQRMGMDRAPGVSEAVLACEPDYIAAGLDAVEAHYGSIEGYLETALGVGAAERALLREALTE